MSDSVPFRSRASNIACATAAPAALHLVASRALNDDRSMVLLRADLSDLSFPAARRHALQILDVVARKWHGVPVDVQLLDAQGMPVLLIGSGPTAGGAS